jgi:hypothetical protein
VRVRRQLLSLALVAAFLIGCASSGPVLTVARWSDFGARPHKVAVLPFAFRGDRFQMPPLDPPMMLLDERHSVHFARCVWERAMALALAAEFSDALGKSTVYELDDSWMRSVLTEKQWDEVQHQVEF